MGILSKLFGKGTDIQALINAGATRIDVRTPREFSAGHVKGWKNIPMNQMSDHVDNLKAAGKPVVLCCASGIRSGQAASQLRRAGIDAHNAGGWAKWK